MTVQPNLSVLRQVLDNLEVYQEHLPVDVEEPFVNDYNRDLQRLDDVGIDSSPLCVDEKSLHYYRVWHEYGEEYYEDRDRLRYTDRHRFVIKLAQAIRLVRRTIEAAQAEAISAPQISNSLGSSTAAQPPSELKLKPAEQSLLLRLDSALIADVASIGSPIWQTEEFGRKALFHPEFEGQLFYPDWRAFHRLVASGLVRVATEKDEQGVEGIAVRLTALGSAYASDLLDEVVQLKDQRVTVPDRGPGNNTVWVIEGQDKKAHDLVYGLLHAAGLRPLEFDQAASLTGKPSPTIMEILEAAFKEGQAFLALFTPDEQVSLRPELRKKTPEVISNTGVDWTEPTADEKPEYQPRPNAILEAGMAFALHPDRTVVLEMGAIRPISDIAGIHTVRWKQDDVSTRRKLLEKLRLAGCMPDTSGSHWMEVGKEKQSG